MAIAIQNLSQLLTYEQYLNEGVIKLRYDILDGVRIVSNPTSRHQDILLNLGEAFRDYQRKQKTGRVQIAPRDVLIWRAPLRTRQPDVLFISMTRLAQNPPSTDPAPISPAPELVVEILSPSDTKKVLAAKIADYQSVNVLECWVVSPGARTVEVVSLTADLVESVRVYDEMETVQSVQFPDLQVAVADILAE